MMHPQLALLQSPHGGHLTEVFVVQLRSTLGIVAISRPAPDGQHSSAISGWRSADRAKRDSERPRHRTGEKTTRRDWAGMHAPAAAHVKVRRWSRWLAGTDEQLHNGGMEEWRRMLRDPSWVV